MNTRLTHTAFTATIATLAVLATVSLAWAAGLQHDAASASANAQPLRTVQLERVVITAKRLPQDAR